MKPLYRCHQRIHLLPFSTPIRSFLPIRIYSFIISILFSLTSCYEGLGVIDCESDYEGDYENSAGRLAYEPPSSYEDFEVVDELSTLLTSGRMSASNRKLVQDAFTTAYGEHNDRAYALRVAQQLIVSSPEFHTNSISSNTVTKREVDESISRKSCKKYKAVVHIHLSGGMDSYNLLVPYSGCSGQGKFCMHE